jgi:hypothetical protein
MSNDNEGKKVPTAYVTKWATTVGIMTVNDGEVYTSGSSTNYLTKRGKSSYSLFVAPAHWTTSKEEAETRYRKALRKAADAAHKKHAALVAAINAPPKYAKEDES